MTTCVDPDAARRREFQEFWNVREALPDVRGLTGRSGEFDVISICSPTPLHSEHLSLALDLRPRLVFCEKPVTSTAEEGKRWANRFGAAGIPVAVNYTRRWAPDIVRLRNELDAGTWGEVRSAIGVYGKGLLNNGSHLIDLLHFLLGPLSVEAAGPPVHDFWESDASFPAMLRSYGGVPVHLANGHAKDFSLFELHLITRQGVIGIEDGGLRWRVRRATESPQFAGYTSLSEGSFQEGQYELAMTRAVENIQQVLNGNSQLASTLETALQAQVVCEQIQAMASKRIQEPT